jgi:energy-coupling factor transporter ATP-binding protein EcfA2
MATKVPQFDWLRLKNVRCFRDAEIPLDKRVTAIVGGNASGKTTLMEALASVTHGEDEGLRDFPLRHGTARGEITLYEHDRKSPVARWDSKVALRQRLPAEHYVFLYGRYRRVSSPDSREDARNLTDTQYLDELASHAAQSRTLTLTRPDNRLLQDLTGYIRGMNKGRESDPRLETVWSRLNAALPSVQSLV